MLKQVIIPFKNILIETYSHRDIILRVINIKLLNDELKHIVNKYLFEKSTPIVLIEITNEISEFLSYLKKIGILLDEPIINTEYESGNNIIINFNDRHSDNVFNWNENTYFPKINIDNILCNFYDIGYII